jgi:hypothetical protein
MPSRSTVAALALALFGLALYARSIGFEFVDFDDRRVLLAHPQLYDEHSLLSSLRQILFEYFPREEPLLLRDVSWAVDARLFGFENPVGYHLGNVLLNAANGALLFLFLRRATGRFTLSLAIAAAFVALPVHVEAVSWVMGRKDVLSTSLVLAALLAQAGELEQTKAARRWSLWLLTFLLTILALLAKIAAFSCVPLLALHRTFHPYLAGRRAPEAKLDWGRVLRGGALLLPHAAATVAIVLWYQGVLSQFGIIGRHGPGTFSAEHLTNVAVFVPLLIGCYLRSLIWPFGLSAFYRWPHVEVPLSAEAHLASLGIAAAVAAGLAYCCLRRRDLAFYALGFFALLLPYLGLVYVDIWRADRYIYLASFAVLAIAADSLARFAERRGPLGRGAVAALALSFTMGCALQTLRHEAVWRDNESLWSYEAYLPEPSLLSLRALAAEYAGRAERETDATKRQALSQQARREAVRGIEREAALGRKRTGYQSNEQLQLARLHGMLGRLDRIDGAPLESQIAHYEESFRLAPYRATAFELAKLYLERGLAAPEPERERIVRISFDRYVAYLALSSNDPAWRERNQAFLTKVYERNFPFLGGAVAAARRTYFQ